MNKGKTYNVGPANCGALNFAVLDASEATDALGQARPPAAPRG
jgi:hypothetical protein